MTRSLIAVILCGVIFFSGCMSDPRVGKLAVVTEQCHMYDSPSIYYKEVKLGKQKNPDVLKKLTSSEHVRWAYKGVNFYILRVKGKLAQVRQTGEIKAWWIPVKNLRVQEYKL